MIGAILKSQYIFGHITPEPQELRVPVLGINLSTRKVVWVFPVPTKKDNNVILN
jgi:hypothetical protein